MLVGGKGMRAIESLKARIQFDRSGHLSMALDAMENAESDAPNFPSRKAVLRLLLKDGRFVEVR